MSVSTNDLVTGENEGESLQATEDSSTLAQSRVSTESESIVYALPKTYNGKTVTDLFPEFEHNKVFPERFYFSQTFQFKMFFSLRFYAFQDYSVSDV